MTCLTCCAGHRRAAAGGRRGGAPAAVAGGPQAAGVAAGGVCAQAAGALGRASKARQPGCYALPAAGAQPSPGRPPTCRAALPAARLRAHTARRAAAQANKAQLTAAVASQVEATKSGLDCLNRAHQALLKMRENFTLITRLCAECQSLIDCHDKIQLLSAVHSNLRKTLQVGSLPPPPTGMGGSRAGAWGMGPTEVAALRDLGGAPPWLAAVGQAPAAWPWCPQLALLTNSLP